MALKVFEGTWEEIQAHQAELRGHRLRVIVLPEHETPMQETLLDFLGEFIGCVDGSKEPVAEHTEQLLETIIAEKHRAQGLDV